MRVGDWKLVATSDLSEIELYNLARDPQETTDLREMEPQQYQELVAQLKPLHAEIEAEGPDWWKRLDVNGADRARKKIRRKLLKAGQFYATLLCAFDSFIARGVRDAEMCVSFTEDVYRV